MNHAPQPAALPLRPPSPSTSARPEKPYSAFWPTFWLAVILVLCKVCHRPFPPEASIKDLTVYAADLAMLSAADVTYCLVLGLVAQLLIRATRSKPLLNRLTWASILFFFTLSAMFAVSSVKVFDFLRTPLTYSLFYLGGDFRQAKSSVSAFCTPAFIFIIAASPFLYLSTVWLTMHRPPARNPALRFLRAFFKIHAVDLTIMWLLCATALIVTLPAATLYKHLVAPFPVLLARLPLPLHPASPQYPAYGHKTENLAMWAGIAWACAPLVALFLILAIRAIFHLAMRRNHRIPPTPQQPLPDRPPEQSPLRSVALAALSWRLAQAMFIWLILVFAMVAHRELRGVWGANHRGNQHVNFRAADNPHYALIKSTVRELLFKPSVRLSESYPPDFLDEFKTVGERGGGAPTGKAPRGPKNIIILIGESLGAQHMQICGGKYATTPNLIAEQSHCLVFDNVYSHITNTSNALVAMLLGIYPPITWREWTVERPDFPGTSLAEVLKARGYATAFISGGDNRWSNQDNFLARRGFDTIWDYRDCGSEPPPSWEFSWGVPDHCLMDMLEKWIDQRDPNKNFLVVSWTQGTHHNYYAGPQHREVAFWGKDEPPDAWDLNRYCNAIHELDIQLKRLFDKLRTKGLDKDTLVVITGDHGEAFGWPHNTYSHTGRVYQEDVRVPFILWNPAIFTKPQRSQTIGAHVDLNPTILDILHLTSPSSWQGRSLFDPDRPPRAYFFGAHGSFIYGVREDNWKYIYDYEEDIGFDELYDLAADPNEQTNLADKHPHIARQLRQRLAAWLDYEADHQPK